MLCGLWVTLGQPHLKGDLGMKTPREKMGDLARSFGALSRAFLFSDSLHMDAMPSCPL
jgi:hypothetical protein